MGKYIATMLAFAALVSMTPAKASAKGMMLTAIYLCEGVRYDHVTTYKYFIDEHALDMQSMNKMRDPETEANEAVVLKSMYLNKRDKWKANVQKSQITFCDKISDNW